MKVCIYHNNCLDGFGAAIAVRKRFDDVIFHKGIYQETPPDVTNKEVIMVDFSYKREVIVEMAKHAKHILIIDHHESAEKNLIDLPVNVNVVFDTTKSGAVLVWEYFHPGKEVPPLFLHIQDRDLWVFKLEGTEDVTACLFSFPYCFDKWDEILALENLRPFQQDGVAIRRKQTKDIKELIQENSYRTILAGHDVPILNCPYMFASEAGHIMGEDEPFAVCFSMNKTHVVYSLRSSKKGGLNVAEIAEQFGGGGHKHAAGYSTKR